MLLLVFIPALIIGCKPKAEPDFPYGPPPGDYPVIARSDEAKPAISEGSSDGESSGVTHSATGGNSATSGSHADPDDPEPDDPEPDEPKPDEPKPDEPKPHDPGEPDAGSVVESPDVGVAEESTDGTVAPAEPDAGQSEPIDAGPEPGPAALQLSDAVLATLQKKASRKDRLEAKRLNRKGLKQHKKGNYVEAASAYEQALVAHPQFKYPRFNLACALSLSGRNDEALGHLLVLRELGENDKLRDARVDNDLALLRTDPRFKQLTGFARVEVRRMARVQRDVLKAVGKLVKKQAKLLAFGDGLSPQPVRETTVFFRDGFEAQAREVAALFGGAPVQLAGDQWRTVDAEVMLVIAHEEDVSAAASAGLERFYDVQLEGRGKKADYTLRLKSTGFFEQRAYFRESDLTTTRKGTFKVDDGKLARSYREVEETEDDSLPPKEKTDRVTFKVEDGRLVVDGVRYKP